MAKTWESKARRQKAAAGKQPRIEKTPCGRGKGKGGGKTIPLRSRNDLPANHGRLAEMREGDTVDPQLQPVNCVCDNNTPYPTNEETSFIYCETCTTWQHHLCMGFHHDADDNDSRLPEPYVCSACKPEAHPYLNQDDSVWKPRRQMLHPTKGGFAKQTGYRQWLQREILTLVRGFQVEAYWALSLLGADKDSGVVDAMADGVLKREIERAVELLAFRGGLEEVEELREGLMRSVVEGEGATKITEVVFGAGEGVWEDGEKLEEMIEGDEAMVRKLWVV